MAGLTGLFRRGTTYYMRVVLPLDHPLRAERPTGRIVISLGSSNYREALSKGYAKRAEILTGVSNETVTTAPSLAPRIHNPISPALTLQELHLRWQAANHTSDDSSRSCLRAIHLFEEFSGKVKLGQINRDMGDKFRSWLQQQPTSSKTARDRLVWVKSLLNYASQDLELIPKNPWRGLDIKAHTESPRQPWSEESLSKLFSHPIWSGGLIPKAAKAGGSAAYWIPLLALYSGARCSELCQLRTDDIKKESGRDDDQPLTIPHRRLGEKFIELYWQQSAPFKGDGVLIQNNASQAAVISQIAQFRSKHQASTVATARLLIGYKQLLRSVTKTVVAYPVNHIQNLGGKKGKLEQFLFHIDTESITLLPGIAYCLRRFQPLVQQLARSHWIDHIKRNKQNLALLGQDNDLEAFLFETSRQSLFIVQTGLRKISNKCFYCGSSVSDADVDHFIPHSLYPRDLAHNFVLAHQSCNRSKSDTLAAKAHLHRWLEFVESNADDLSQIGYDAGIMADEGSMDSVARWGYANAVAGGGQGWVKPNQYEPIDDSYLKAWA